MSRGFYARSDSRFVESREDLWGPSSIHDTVHRYHVVTREGRALLLDIWNPRVECSDADERTGAPIYDWLFDRLSYAGREVELTEEDSDSFMDAVIELLRDSDS